MAKRTVHFEGTAAPAIVISKLVEVDMPKRNFFMEEMADGTFRLTCSRSLVPDLSALTGLRIER